MRTQNNFTGRAILQWLLGISLALSPFYWTVSRAQGMQSNLEEVKVTARRVEENLQETPVAISAFSAEAIERRMLSTTEDLGRVTPNLQFKGHAPLSGNASAAQVFIRGIGQSDASGGVDPGVGLYIDEVYMGRTVGGIMEFRDIANVQVLRGPQGTLFGRNTIGGAVLLTTHRPGKEFGGTVRVGGGEDSLKEFFGALDLPLSDSAQARISYGSRERDGYVERIYDGKDLGNEDSYTVNASLNWDPTESFNLIFRTDYTKEEENGSPFVFAAITEGPPAVFAVAASVDAGCPGATFPPPAVPGDVVDQRCANNITWDLGEFTNGGNSKTGSTVENSGSSITATWNVTEELAVKSITAQRDLEWSGARDADNTYLTILSTDYESEASQFSEELQFLYNSDTYSGVAGLFYFEEEVDDFLRVPFGNPAALLPPGRAVSWDYQDAHLENDNWAVFTNWNFNLTDALSLSLGIRKTQEEKSIRTISMTDATPLPLVDDGNGIFVPGEFPDPTFPDPDDPASYQPLPSDPARQPTGAPLSGRYNVFPRTYTRDFDATTGSFSLSYEFTGSFMSYLSWSEGFKSGGFNQRFNDRPPNGLDPTPFASEEAETLEIGFKSDLSDYLRLNGAWFTTDYKNMQLTYRAGIVPVLFNAGESSISGAELEFTYHPNADFILEGSLGYLDDEINSVAIIPGATQTLGPENDLPFTPELSASLGAAYTFHMGDYDLTPRLDVAYTDEQFFDTGNTVQVAQTEAVTVYNFSLVFGSSDREWNVVAGVENLTDEIYPIAGNSSLTTATGYAEIIYSRPRSAYLKTTYNF